MMLKKGLVAISTLLLVGMTSEASTFSTVKGQVVSVSDGDTIHFLPDNKDLLSQSNPEKDWTVRLMGIDTPETHLAIPGGIVNQGYWGEYAAQYMTDLLKPGTKIELEVSGKDVHGRVLGKIIYKGKDINLQEVREGIAVMYAICGGDYCDDTFMKNQRIAEYRDACLEAVQNQRGIFSESNPLRELPFEFRLRMQKRQPDKFVGNYQTHRLFKPADYDQVPVCDRVFFLTEKDGNNQGFSQ